MPRMTLGIIKVLLEGELCQLMFYVLTMPMFLISSTFLCLCSVWVVGQLPMKHKFCRARCSSWSPTLCLYPGLELAEISLACTTPSCHTQVLNIMHRLLIYTFNSLKYINYINSYCCFMFLVKTPKPLKRRDFVTQRSWREFGDTYMILNHSVFHKV